MTSNCSVELLNVCVCVCFIGCMCLAISWWQILSFFFFPVCVDTCSTTEFKSWVPTHSGVSIIWQGCELFHGFVVFTAGFWFSLQTSEGKRQSEAGTSLFRDRCLFLLKKTQFLSYLPLPIRAARAAHVARSTHQNPFMISFMFAVYIVIPLHESVLFSATF